MKIGKSAVVLLSALLVVSAPRPWLTPVRAATAIIATPTRITRVVITAGAACGCSASGAVAVRRAAAQGDSDRYSGSTLLERLRRVHRPLKAALRQHLDLAIAEDKCHRHGNIV